MTMEPTSPSLILGWKEWLALPDLGLPAIKAKIDTGARTSALHAFSIERRDNVVSFGLHPVPGRHHIERLCTAPVVGQRVVMSSSGDRELRYAIETRLHIGGHIWPIEVTLTDREDMTYRMLLGRQALRRGIYIDPAASYLQPKLSYKSYRPLRRRGFQ
ncbi:MAG: ATP-dependent zinc protease family protein [Hyphomicrobiaceae bacterium]